MPWTLHSTVQKFDEAIVTWVCSLQVLAGGNLSDVNSTGQFYPPTVLADVTPRMRIWQEEVFGPVISILKFETDDEAVSLANNSAFGLGSAVWSSDLHRANKIAGEMQRPAGNTNLMQLSTCRPTPAICASTASGSQEVW